MKKLITMFLFSLFIYVPNVLGAEIRDIPPINQYPELPTGCEATSITMLLNWGGVSVDKLTVANAIPKGKNPYSKNGILYGSNPEKTFVGSPYDKHSFGMYQVPSLQVIEHFLPNRGEDLTGQNFNAILENIDRNRPVMVWATIKMLKPYVSVSWLDENNQKVNWMANEHALLLVGYTDTTIIVNDPYTGRKEHYNRQLFEQRWNELGRRAITLNEEQSKETEEAFNIRLNTEKEYLFRTEPAASVQEEKEQKTENEEVSLLSTIILAIKNFFKL